MKNRNCPNKDMCWDYNASNCEGCVVGEKIARLVRQNKKLKAENAELKGQLAEAEHRVQIAERALDKTCEDIGQLMDCCRWAANGGVITIEEYTPEKATPQAYIDRAEKELTEEKKDD